MDLKMYLFVALMFVANGVVKSFVQPIDICIGCDALEQQCCLPGYRGPGDCFNPPQESCCNGQVCRNGQHCCPRGLNANGGCYASTKQQCCNDGLVCGSDQQCCDGFCGNEDCKQD